MQKKYTFIDLFAGLAVFIQQCIMLVENAFLPVNGIKMLVCHNTLLPLLMSGELKFSEIKTRYE